MSLRRFVEFVNLGVVRKQTPNRQRAASLVKESESKREFLRAAMRSIPSDKMNPNFIAESCYDILMELIRAKMFLDGFNSKGSHEAEVSYMENMGFSVADMRFMDELRYNRNGIKYYGTMLNKEYAAKVLAFLNKTYPRIMKILSGL